MTRLAGRLSLHLGVVLSRGWVAECLGVRSHRNPGDGASLASAGAKGRTITQAELPE